MDQIKTSQWLSMKWLKNNKRGRKKEQQRERNQQSKRKTNLKREWTKLSLLQGGYQTLPLLLTLESLHSIPMEMVTLIQQWVEVCMDSICFLTTLIPRVEITNLSTSSALAEQLLGLTILCLKCIVKALPRTEQLECLTYQRKWEKISD